MLWERCCFRHGHIRLSRSTAAWGFTKDAEADDESPIGISEAANAGLDETGGESIELSKNDYMGPAIVMLYAFVMTIFSYDWAMSLEPHWFGTMFGPWYFHETLWGGVTVTGASGASTFEESTKTLRRPTLACNGRHDLGKLTFAFTVFWGYLFFSRYIGNLKILLKAVGAGVDR